MPKFRFVVAINSYGSYEVYGRNADYGETPAELEKAILEEVRNRFHKSANLHIRWHEIDLES